MSGSSGGGVLDDQGKVRGIIQAKQGESVIYAIPAEVAQNLIRRSKDPRRVAEQWLEPIGGTNETKRSPSARVSVGTRVYCVGTSILAGSRLDDDALLGIGPRSLTILRNEPFARRGYIFRRPELRAAFLLEDWYSPRTKDLAAVQKTFTKLESYNVDFIKRFQDRHGLNW